LSPEKGFDVFIEAAARVSAQRPSVGFVVFGEGPRRRDLERRVRETGLEGRFVLAGFRADLDRYLPVLDAFVLSSFTEGMPNVVLEAMAVGVPVVATAVGGTPELIEDGRSGLLVPPGDSAALAAGISRVMASPGLARTLGRNACERVHAAFSFSAQAQQYCRFFEDVLADRCSARDQSNPRDPASRPFTLGCQRDR
jgi:glycosyltransferase involved in cell wall biosynthesis